MTPQHIWDPNNGMNLVKPWIGSDYFSGGIAGKRILIVGEGAYKRGGFPPGYDETLHTLALAAEAIGSDEGRGHWNKRKFYVRLAWIFGIDPRSYGQRKALWNSLAYCNFVGSIFTQPKEKPLPIHWELGRRAFAEVLNLTDPHIAICFSRRMWTHIPKSVDTRIANKYRVYARRAVSAIDGTRSVQLFGFKHPTSEGFNWKYVQEILGAHVHLGLDRIPPEDQSTRRRRFERITGRSRQSEVLGVPYGR
jgi:hypothetical protein